MFLVFFSMNTVNYFQIIKQPIHQISVNLRTNLHEMMGSNPCLQFWSSSKGIFSQFRTNPSTDLPVKWLSDPQMYLAYNLHAQDVYWCLLGLSQENLLSLSLYQLELCLETSTNKKKEQNTIYMYTCKITVNYDFICHASCFFFQVIKG